MVYGKPAILVIAYYLISFFAVLLGLTIWLVICLCDDTEYRANKSLILLSYWHVCSCVLLFSHPSHYINWTKAPCSEDLRSFFKGVETQWGKHTFLAECSWHHFMVSVHIKKCVEWHAVHVLALNYMSNTVNTHKFLSWFTVWFILGHYRPFI